MAKVTLPMSLLEMSQEDRENILAVLLQAQSLPKEKQLPRAQGDEHNMWMRNVDDLLAEVEDDFYLEMIGDEARRMAGLYLYLGLPVDDLDIQKSFEPDYLAFEDTLIKGKNTGTNKMSQFIKELAQKGKKRVEAFMKWTQDGKSLTKDQLKGIDDILRKQRPNYLNRAEDYMIRAGFIGKIRGEAEKQNWDTVGAIIDRFPESIEASQDERVVLTLREKEKAEARGQKVKVMPLTPLEAEAVKHASHHAGDKITEISEKHMAGVRQLVIRAKKERWSAQKLAQELFDTFGDHNRDWRRVAITELAFVANDAYLSGCEEGDTLIGMGAVGACKHCERLIIGKQVTVTHKIPEKETYHTDTNLVWVGKSNYGRRVSEYLTAIPLHPHCRCRWHRISRFYKLGENGKLVLKDTAELINEERAKRGLAPDPRLEGSTQEERLQKMSENFLKNL